MTRGLSSISRFLLSVFLSGALVAGFAVSAQAQSQKKILVFAAASLKDALELVAADYETETGTKVVLSFAGTSAIARQIASGAPADIFISADVEWIAWLQAQGFLEPSTRRVIARNRLALVSPVGADIAIGKPVAEILHDWFVSSEGRLAIADPDHVPAGRYAKAALQVFDPTIAPYDEFARRFAITENVRLASLLVSRAETPLGIVYLSDALVDEGIKPIGLFDEGTHPAIVYPAVKTKLGSDLSDGFLDFLISSKATLRFKEVGLAPPE